MAPISAGAHITFLWAVSVCVGAGALAVALFMPPESLAQFRFAQEEYTTIRQPVAVTGAVRGRYYAVFNPDDIRVNGSYCAVMTGDELIEFSADARKYGTCFVNDTGTFEVFELRSVPPGTYAEIVNSPDLIGVTTVTISQL